MSVRTGTTGLPRADHHRPDIEGLRGLAILLVVIFHAGPFGVTGGFIGVDVFFVISGFLITGLLLRERERSGRIDLAAFYARRMRRLLPAASIALVVTLLLSIWAVPPLDLSSVALDGASAALWVSNFRFALAGGYFDAPGDPSPFLHFWSLSVEEQFYLFWPLLLLLAARLGRPRLMAGLVLALVTAGSLIFCISLTQRSPDWAFYMLPTRAWQLGLGGLLAVAGTALARGGRLVGLLGWVGLAAVLVAAVGFDETLAYPGAWALVPTVGTAALIASGEQRWGPRWLLTVAPMRFLGRISYALYLWHWPLLALAATAAGTDLPLTTRLALVAAAVVLATVSTLVVEEPIRSGVRLPSLARFSERALAAGLATVIACVGLSAAVATKARVDLLPPGDGGDIIIAGPGDPDPGFSDEPVLELPSGDAFVDMPSASEGPGPSADLASGAPSAPATAPPSAPATPDPAPTPDPTAGSTSDPDPTSTPALTAGPSVAPPATSTPAPTPRRTPRPKPTPKPTPVSYVLPSNLRPSLADARSDEERLRDDGCLAFEEATVPRDCVYGDPDGRFTVALVGDSHASHWFPAIERVAKERGWRLVTFVKVSCPFSDLLTHNFTLKRDYVECPTFVRNSIDRLKSIKPDLVVTSTGRWVHPVRSADESFTRQGEAIGRALDKVSGVKVVIKDVPYSYKDIPGCLSRNPSDIRECALGRATVTYGGAGPRDEATARVADAAVIDFSRLMCEGSTCPAVLGRIIVYRDDHHLTATFARAMGPALDRALQRVLSER